MEWIKILKKDRTMWPNSNRDVLVEMNDKTIFMACCVDKMYWKFYFSDQGLQADDRREKDLKSWMELPSNSE